RLSRRWCAFPATQPPSTAAAGFPHPRRKRLSAARLAASGGRQASRSEPARTARGVSPAATDRRRERAGGRPPRGDHCTRVARSGLREVRAGRNYREEYRCRCADGQIGWLAEDIQIEPLAPGRWRAVGVCTDITERKRAEIALRESEHRFRAQLAELDHLYT